MRNKAYQGMSNGEAVGQQPWRGSPWGDLSEKAISKLSMEGEVRVHQGKKG